MFDLSLFESDFNDDSNFGLISQNLSCSDVSNRNEESDLMNEYQRNFYFKIQNDTKKNDNDFNGFNNSGHTAANSDEKQFLSESGDSVNDNNHKQENNNRIISPKKEDQKEKNIPTAFNFEDININILNDCNEIQKLNEGDQKLLGRKRKDDKSKKAQIKYNIAMNKINNIQEKTNIIKFQVTKVKNIPEEYKLKDIRDIFFNEKFQLKDEVKNKYTIEEEVLDKDEKQKLNKEGIKIQGRKKKMIKQKGVIQITLLII